MARNYCNNSSFELSLTDTWEANGVGNLDRTQVGDALEGTWFGRLTATGSGNPNISQAAAAYIPANEGEDWTVSVGVRWGAGTPKQVHVDILWLDAAGATIDSNIGSLFTPADSAWLRITNNNNTAPAGTRAFFVRVVGVGMVLGDELLVDAFMVEKGNFEQPSPWTAGPDEIRTPVLAGPPRYPLVQFVTEPSSAPTVLFDCNTFGGIYVTDPDFSEFTLGAPDADREPEQVNLDDGYRTAEFTVHIDSGYTDASAHISALSKILQRDKGWLLFQREALHQPVFLRWYRSEDQAVSWERAKHDEYSLPVILDCDPFLRGEPVILPTQVIVNNPADAGANPASYELPPIKGDAPAPLRVQIVPDIGPDWSGFQPFMASTAYDASEVWGGPILWDLVAAQWLDAGNGTGGDVADAAYVGGSYRLTDLDLVSSLATRLVGGPATAPPPGLYKALVRVTLTQQLAFSQVQVRMGQIYNGTQIRYGKTVLIDRANQISASPYTCWADLGEFMFPFGAQHVDLDDIDAAAIPEIQLDCGRVQGSCDFRWDCVLLIPISTSATLFDSRTQSSRFQGSGLTVNRTGVWDGEKERFAAYDNDTTWANQRQPDIRGGWLEVVPGASNVFHLLQQSETGRPFDVTGTFNDVIINTADVTLSYLPRYLHLRPDTE